MKNKIVYGFLFLIAFLITTGGIVFMNSIYKNIFRYDFRLEALADTSKMKDSTKTLNASMAAAKADSLRKADSLKTLNNNNLSSDSLKSTQNPSNLQANGNNPQSGASASTKPDTAYISWMKQTAKLYESMDSKKAAKIIQSYSDNIARDIIYSMKQKKAAEILSELNPDAATRITRAKSNAF